MKWSTTNWLEACPRFFFFFLGMHILVAIERLLLILSFELIFFVSRHVSKQGFQNHVRTVCTPRKEITLTSSISVFYCSNWYTNGKVFEYCNMETQKFDFLKNKSEKAENTAMRSILNAPKWAAACRVSNKIIRGDIRYKQHEVENNQEHASSSEKDKNRKQWGSKKNTWRQ